jgi:hypothetical protein
MSLETRDAGSSGVIRMVGGSDFVHVIMPVHVAR